MKLNTKVNLFSMLLTSVILIGSFTGIYYLYKEFAFSTEAEQLQARANELTTAISALESMDGIDSIFGAYLPTDGAIIVREIDDNTGKPLIRLQKPRSKLILNLIRHSIIRKKQYMMSLISHLLLQSFCRMMKLPRQS